MSAVSMLSKLRGHMDVHMCKPVGLIYVTSGALSAADIATARKLIRHGIRIHLASDEPIDGVITESEERHRALEQFTLSSICHSSVSRIEESLRSPASWMANMMSSRKSVEFTQRVLLCLYDTQSPVLSALLPAYQRLQSSMSLPMPTVYLTKAETAQNIALEGSMTLSSPSPGLHTVAAHLLGERLLNDATAYQFGSHLIGAGQVFFSSRHSIAFTNIRPVLSGHVLVVPRRHATRYTDLAADELEDLSSVVQLVGETLETHYKANSLTITVQDGPAAGQTVDHVHVHVLPRWDDDLPYAQKDDVYTHIDTSEQSQIHRSASHSLAVDPFPHDKARREMASPSLRKRFDVTSPPPLRTLADMESEAEIYRELLRPMQHPDFQTSSV